MESKNNILNIAEDYLATKRKSNFAEILNHIKTKVTIPAEEEEKFVGNLYTGMVTDPRFFYKSGQMWYLRKNVSLDEVKYQVSAIIEDQEQKDEYDVEDTETITPDSDEEDDDKIMIVEDDYDDGDIEQGKKEIDIDNLD